MVDYEAIILAGGLGTRLREIIGEYPKPMAPINNKPFLWYLLKLLNDSGFYKVILSVGYKKEIIMDYFGTKFGKLDILYSCEDEPLGTGGAVKLALNYVSSDNIYVLNGDTYFRIDFRDLYRFHTLKEADITLALKHTSDASRYGTVRIDDSNRVIEFKEKAKDSSGYINAGIYVLRTNKLRNVLQELKSMPLSFELDVLRNYTTDLRIYGKPFYNYFIDIGIGEDYERAKEELKRFEN